MPWYTELPLTNISLGSLFTLVVLRVITGNLRLKKQQNPSLPASASASTSTSTSTSATTQSQQVLADAESLSSQVVPTARDPYLHMNAMAALSNLSAQSARLHPYVAQRYYLLLCFCLSEMQRTHSILLSLFGVSVSV